MIGLNVIITNLNLFIISAMDYQHNASWPQMCEVCKCRLANPPSAHQHYGGRKHREALEALTGKIQSAEHTGTYLYFIQIHYRFSHLI